MLYTYDVPCVSCVRGQVCVCEQKSWDDSQWPRWFLHFFVFSDSWCFCVFQCFSVCEGISISSFRIVFVFRLALLKGRLFTNLWLFCCFLLVASFFLPLAWELLFRFWLKCFNCFFALFKDLTRLGLRLGNFCLLVFLSVCPSMRAMDSQYFAVHGTPFCSSSPGRSTSLQGTKGGERTRGAGFLSCVFLHLHRYYIYVYIYIYIYIYNVFIIFPCWV